mgnify:CR=1 FL=1
MRKWYVLLFCLFWGMNAHAAQMYGERICKQSRYLCHKVQAHESWSGLFPDDDERDLVKRLNRMNIPLRRGMVIAIPKELGSLDLMDISPFPESISAPGTSTIQVDQDKLAWGAYDSGGRLVNWGPISAGKSYCPDIKSACRTVKGKFTIYRKQGEGCVSSRFPRPHGGAKMPFCMHFFKGFALHGSYTVPGRNDSHGCVRMFVQDAEWLNQNFIKVGVTKVLIR